MILIKYVPKIDWRRKKKKKILEHYYIKFYLISKTLIKLLSFLSFLSHDDQKEEHKNENEYLKGDKTLIQIFISWQKFLYNVYKIFLMPNKNFQ